MAEVRGGLKVPKTPVRVELSLDGEPARPVELFVGDHLPASARRQHVIDLLSGDDDFLPVHDVADEAWTLINKAVISWVAIPLADGALPIEEADASLDEELFDIRRPVAAHLIGGARLTGDLLYSPPDGRARVTDFLNDGSRFFRLWTPTAVYVLNKRHVARIIELQPPP